MAKLKLTYLNLRGRGETIRLAFHIGNIPFEDDRVSFDQFNVLKKQGQFKYGQVPVLYINGEQYAQSTALMRYAGKLSGLYPTDIMEALIIDQALGTIEEIRTKIAPTMFMTDKKLQMEQRQVLSNEILPQWFKYLDDQLQKSESGFFLKNVTIADLELYTTLGWIKSGIISNIPSDLSSKYLALEKLYSQVSNLEKVQEWNKSHNQFP